MGRPYNRGIVGFLPSASLIPPVVYREQQNGRHDGEQDRFERGETS